MHIYVKPHNDYADRLIKLAEKWQRRWAEAGIFSADVDSSRPKFFLTVAFPYPNGPAHMGHGRTYTITDVYARFKRMQGYNVLFPLGFHYTGTPILAMAEKVAEGDEKILRLFRKVYGVPEDIIPELTDPLKLARYFHEISKISFIEMGYSIDWRREFTTIDPEFKAFIRWQFSKLKEKGFLVQGTHPVGWCPRHKMPVGMHDTEGDVEPEIGEWTLLFFTDENGVIFPAATLRPETVFGVTNMWVNPDAVYVKARVDGRVWVLSKRAAWKLTFQLRKVEVIEEFKGSSLLGKRVRNPVTGEKVPILPARFVDPDTGTGVVMSVPAHAPYDYVAVRDLDEETLSRYGVLKKELKPRPLIKVRGYREAPAVEIVEKMGIRSQDDKEKLEEATKKIYGDEFKYGVMREDIIGYVALDAPPEFRGYAQGFVKEWIVDKPVPEARENLVKWLKGAGLADSMYEIMNKPVRCRCGTEIVVKVLQDQWFIDYGNPKWKELARKWLENNRIVPPEYRNDFKYTIEWVQRRACARSRGLGTELPWAPGWIIESLSDSTIYMAFYTVIKGIRRYGIKPGQLTEKFWDYVLLGRGDVEEVSKKVGVPVEALEEIRKEFDYWYPLDSRHSGKDLIPNHLTFFIFNHVAIFPGEKWPRQIVVNGWLLLQGHKMSKSLGNVIPLRIMARMYGPDTVRAAVLLAAEVGQDADFTDQLAESTLEQLRRLEEFLSKLIEISRSAPKKPSALARVDRWVLSRMQRYIEHVTQSMEELKLRDAANTVIYVIEKDVRRYLDRVSGDLNDPGRRGTVAWVIKKIVDAWIRMLAPITPHLAEELWSKAGGVGFVSLASWPRVERDLIDEDVEIAEVFVEKVVDDVRSILRALGKEAPKSIVFYTAPRSSYKLLRRAIEFLEKGGQMRDFVKAVVAEARDRGRTASEARKVYELATQLSEELRRYIRDQGFIDEFKILSDSRSYLVQRLGAEEVIVYSADDPEAPDIGGKKRVALPTKPGIYIEF